MSKKKEIEKKEEKPFKSCPGEHWRPHTYRHKKDWTEKYFIVFDGQWKGRRQKRE